MTMLINAAMDAAQWLWEEITWNIHEFCEEIRDDFGLFLIRVLLLLGFWALTCTQVPFFVYGCLFDTVSLGDLGIAVLWSLFAPTGVTAFIDGLCNGYGESFLPFGIRTAIISIAIEVIFYLVYIL